MGQIVDQVLGQEQKASQKHLRITPSKGWININFRELWEYRELLFFLTWRDVKIRYKQTALGATWAIIQPFMNMIVFSLIFGQLAGLDSEGFPYPIFVYSGQLPWTYFQTSLSNATQSVVNSAGMITKVYFPRLIIPISAVVSGLVDFAVAFVVLIAMMLFYGIAPTIATLLLPVFILLALVTCLGVSLWFSALNVTYRDVRYVIPWLVQLWFFVTPVVYSLDTFDKYPFLKFIVGLNPMAGVVEGFRWALLGKDAPGPMMILSAVVAVLILIGGVYYFRRTERVFADVI